MDPAVSAALDQSPVPAAQIVLELTEHLPVTDYAPLRRSLDALRRRGIRVAVDDAGSGFASFRHILQLAPEIIKLDRELIGGIDADPARRALAAAVQGHLLGRPTVDVSRWTQHDPVRDAYPQLGADLPPPDAPRAS